MKNIIKPEKSQAETEQIHIQFKDRLKAHTGDFQKYVIEDIPSALKIHNLRYQNGFQNIYLQSVIYSSVKPKTPLYCLWLDVESQDHYDIRKNIETASDLLSVLTDRDLIRGLKISLTGFGFRFLYPYYIPSELSKAFLEFIRDFSKLGIDAGVQTAKRFIRLSGYRFNKEQCAKNADMVDRHIHFLTDPHDLFFMSESEYIDRVSGKPDYNADMAVIPHILPMNPIPEPWTEFLKPYRQQAAISESFWQGYSLNTGKISEEQFRNALGDNAGKFIEHESFGAIALLKKCPLCNRNGSFVTDKGRLKCWHTSCTAGERDPEGKIIGLPAREWNPEIAVLLPESEPAEVSDPEVIPEYKTTEIARDGINRAILSNQDYLINVMPGVGKTTTTLKAIAPFCKDYPILYITPNHALNGEILESAKRLDINEPHILYGRNHKNCEKFKVVNTIGQQGYSVKFTICSSCIRYKENNCLYYEQFKDKGKPGLWITTHSQSKYLDMNDFQFKLVVIDENPLDSFFKRGTSLGDQIRFFRSGGDDLVKSFFDKIQSCADKTLEKHALNKGRQDKHSRFYAGDPPKGSYWENKPKLFETAGITQEEINAVDRHLSVWERWDNELSVYQWHMRLWKKKINLSALTWLFNAIKQNGTAYLKTDCRKRNPIKYITWQKHIPAAEGVRIVNLDATGNKADLDALFGRDFQVLDGNVEMPGLKKTWLKLNTGKRKLINLPGKKITEILKKAITYLRDTDQRILLLTFKDIKESALTIPQKLLPGRTVDAVHFGAGRGLNKWKDFDAVICFGWLNVDRKESLDLAQSLHEKEEDREEFHLRLGKNEVLQGVHRIRPVNGDKNIIIIARNWLSELGKPDSVKDLRKTAELFEEALERCESWLKRYNCIDRRVMWALGICTNRDEKTAIRHFMAFKKIRTEQNSEFFRNENLLKFGDDESIYGRLLKVLSEKYDLAPAKILIDSRWSHALGKKEDFQKLYQQFGKWNDACFKEC